MSSNELIGIMKEFGVEVRMLGTDEAPNPNGLALADMLTEIHRLRTRIAAVDVDAIATAWHDNPVVGIHGDDWLATIRSAIAEALATIRKDND